MEIEASSNIVEESKLILENEEAQKINENSEPSGIEGKQSDSESEEEKKEEPDESSNLKDSDAESEPEDWSVNLKLICSTEMHTSRKSWFSSTYINRFYSQLIFTTAQKDLIFFNWIVTFTILNAEWSYITRVSFE